VGNVVVNHLMFADAITYVCLALG